MECLPQILTRHALLTAYDTLLMMAVPAFSIGTLQHLTQSAHA